MTATIRRPVRNWTRSIQCEPMSPTARSEPPLSGSRRQFQSVSRKQPVLEVVAGDEADVAEAAVGDELANVLVERVEADVEVDRVDGPLRAASSTRPADSVGRHRQRLLAHDVLAGGEDRLRLRDVEVVRGRDVDDVDARVVEDRVEATGRPWPTPSAAARAAPRSGGAAEHAADLDADPAQLPRRGPCR